MLLQALRQIGEAIAEAEFADEWGRYYTPGKMTDAQAVLVIQLEENPNGSLSFTGTELQDPGDPTELARQSAYAYNHKRDKSLTQYVAGNPGGNLEYLLEWPDRDEIGDATSAESLAQLRSVFDDAHDDIVSSVETYFGDEGALSPSSSEPVFITIAITRQDGSQDWPGDLPAVKEGIKNYYQEKIQTTSNATGCAGVAECAVCGTVTKVFGAGAELDKLYALKKQGSFPEHNASLAWKDRPLCIDCITAIETGWERFVEEQNYGVPGVRCRVIPYALPVPDGQERLTVLIQEARQDLLGTEVGTTDPERPLSSAWDEYLKEVDFGVQEDVLRLAFLHYQKNQSRGVQLEFIDGVRQPMVARVVDSAEEVASRGLYERGILPGGAADDIVVTPTERAVFTGMWTYGVLARESTRSGDDPEPADERYWLGLTQTILTHEETDSNSLFAAIAREIRHRAESEQESDTDDSYYSPPFDTIHISEVYCLLRTLSRIGVLQNDTDDPEKPMTELDDNYESLDAAIEAILERHDSIADSPGRRAAYLLGILAGQLSSWQQQRRLNRTFIQNTDLERIGPSTIPKLKSSIWEKAKTYNAQNGNYGIPWKDVHARLDDALLEADRDGWDATRDELQTFYTMGATMSSRLSSLVATDAETEQTPETEQSADTA